MGREDPLEKEMATHSWILAWRTPWTEGIGGLYATPWTIARQAPLPIDTPISAHQAPLSMGFSGQEY